MAEGPLRTMLGCKQPGSEGRIVVWDTDELTVGRAPENDIVVDDTDCSRQHAIFSCGPEGFVLRDLGTANGTSVNKTPVAEHVLENKDVIRVGELQLTFIQTRKDPAALGLEVVFASQLKGFANEIASQDPEATTLGLLDEAQGQFEVGAVGGFQAGENVPGGEPRNLDLEFNDFEPGGTLPSAQPGGVFELTLELEGLSADLRRMLEGLLGKTLDLPQLRVRIKGPDHG
jgi:hypothetical protein